MHWVIMSSSLKIPDLTVIGKANSLHKVLEMEQKADYKTSLSQCFNHYSPIFWLLHCSSILPRKGSRERQQSWLRYEWSLVGNRLKSTALFSLNMRNLRRPDRDIQLWMIWKIRERHSVLHSLYSRHLLPPAVGYLGNWWCLQVLMLSYRE